MQYFKIDPALKTLWDAFLENNPEHRELLESKRAELLELLGAADSAVISSAIEPEGVVVHSPAVMAPALELARDLATWSKQWPRNMMHNTERMKQCYEELYALEDRARAIAEDMERLES